MTNHNLALLSCEKRRDIELRRQAALLIHNFKRGSVTRVRIETEILKLDESEQEKFKSFLNHYKEMTSIKAERKRKTKHRRDGTEKARAMIKQYREMLK